MQVLDGDTGAMAGIYPLLRARRIRRSVSQSIVVSLLFCLIAWAFASRAQALEPGISSTPSTTKPYYACPSGPCTLVFDPPAVKTTDGYELPGGPVLDGSGEYGGLDPRDIQQAYKIPTSDEYGQTVAVVDAYSDPRVQSDLSLYRERFGLGPCTKADGCFSRVNEKGQEGNYPSEGEGFELLGWRAETSLDTQMVAAACPHCHILLVEANTDKPGDMGTSVDTAVRLGATEVSNSYLYHETNEYQPEREEPPFCNRKTGCTQYKPYYEHPGVPITAASGDDGYYGFEGTFPASMPTVIAVGGTNLFKASNGRGWREQAWEETGSGCSAFEPKPQWQTDRGCPRRTENDVAAVAGCRTPVTIVIDGRFGSQGICGTSVATPILAGIEAYATPHTKSLGPEAFYEDPQSLFDVITGSNGTCTRAYLCTAEVGYDAPTGLGTPDGIPFVPTPCEPPLSSMPETPSGVPVQEEASEIEGPACPL